MRIRTLYDPRFLTEHPSFTLRPAGTVTFTMGSVNSGSSVITGTNKKTIFHVLVSSSSSYTRYRYFQYRHRSSTSSRKFIGVPRLQ